MRGGAEGRGGTEGENGHKQKRRKKGQVLRKLP